MTSPPPVIPGAVLLYSFMLPPSWRGLFFFLPRAVWRPLCLSTAFFFQGITFIPFCISSSVRHVWRSCGYPRTFPPGVWCFQRLYIARLRRSGMPIAAPYCSPCRVCAAPLRPWAGCTLAPAAPEGATPQAVPVSGRKTPPISISGTGGEFLPEPVSKSLGVKSRPRQPFSRSAGLNYSRSSSADNSAIFLLIDSFFCAATKSLNAFAANSHL